MLIFQFLRWKTLRGVVGWKSFHFLCQPFSIVQHQQVREQLKFDSRQDLSAKEEINAWRRTANGEKQKKVLRFLASVAGKKNERRKTEVQKEIAVQSSETGTVSRCLAGTFAPTHRWRGACRTLEEWGMYRGYPSTFLVSPPSRQRTAGRGETLRHVRERTTSGLSRGFLPSRPTCCDRVPLFRVNTPEISPRDRTIGWHPGWKAKRSTWTESWFSMEMKSLTTPFYNMFARLSSTLHFLTFVL